MSGRNTGKNIGPFDPGKSIFDFLDAPTLNKIAKAVNQYSNLTVRAPLQLQRGAHGDTLSLAGRIDNFLFVQLTEDLVSEGSATAYILKRDGNDDVDYNVATSDQLEITVHDLIKNKSFKDDVGLALKNPFSKNGQWEFLSITASETAVWIRGTISQDLTTSMQTVTIVSPIDSFHIGSDPEAETALSTIETKHNFKAVSGALFSALLKDSTTDPPTYDAIQIDC